MKKNKIIRNLFVLFCIVYLLGTILVVEKLVTSISNDYLNSSRQEFISEVSLVRSNIESSIFSEVYTANTLATVLTVNKDLALSSFKELSQAVISRGSFVRNIGLSQGYILTHVYPEEGNKKAIGLDYRTLPEQLISVERARKTNQVVLAGPVKLVQGGLGIIARYPIFSDYPDNTEYWGGVSLVLNVDYLLENSGLYAISQRYQIAIRGVDGLGIDGDVFFGAEELFEKPEAAFTIELPHGSWLMVASRNDDNSSGAIYYQTLRYAGYALALLIVILAYFLFRAYRLATRASYRDALTNVLNRRYAMEFLEGKAKSYHQHHSSPFAVLTLDLNNFKQVNDKYGHDAGDYVLKQVSKLIKDRIRESDYIFKLGGDEFLVVLLDMEDVADIENMVSNLRTSIAEHRFNYRGKMLDVTLSVGFARYPHDATSLDKLLRVSDLSMYDDKRSQKL